MSSSGFLLSLDIDRCATRRVPALVACGMLLALVGLGSSRLAWLPLAPAGTLIVAWGLRELRRAGPGSAQSVTRLQVTPGGQFFVHLAPDPGNLVAVTVAQWWVLAGLALGLAFTGQDGRRVQVILFADRLAPDLWRRLLVRLRHDCR